MVRKTGAEHVRFRPTIHHSRRPGDQLLRHALRRPVADPKAWNQLPAHLQALETVGPFKTALKTYLHFTQ